MSWCLDLNTQVEGVTIYRYGNICRGTHRLEGWVWHPCKICGWVYAASPIKSEIPIRHPSGNFMQVARRMNMVLRWDLRSRNTGKGDQL